MPRTRNDIISDLMLLTRATRMPEEKVREYEVKLRYGDASESKLEHMLADMREQLTALIEEWQTEDTN